MLGQGQPPGASSAAPSIWSRLRSQVGSAPEATARPTVRARFVALTGLALLALIGPDFGGNRILVAALILFVAIPISIGIDHFADPAYADRGQMVFNVFAAATMVHLAPNAWYACLVIITASIMATTLVFSKAIVAGLVGLGVLSLGLAGWANSVDHWLISLIVLLLIIPVMSIHTSWLVAQHRRVANQVADLVAAAPTIHWEADATTAELLTYTGRIAEITGYKPEEWATIHQADLVQLGENLGELAIHTDAPGSHDTAAEVTFKTRYHRSDGTGVWLQHRLRVSEDPAEAKVVRGVSFDVTDFEEAALTLRQFQDIVDRLESAVVVLDLVAIDGEQTAVVSKANPATRTVIGVKPEDLIALPLGEGLEWLNSTNFATITLDVLKSGSTGGLSRVKVDVTTADGDRRTRRLDIKIFRLPDEQLAVTFTDMTEAVEKEQLIRQQAERDDLTGLPNRAALLDAAERAVAARQTGDQVAILMMDLNRFKEINDTLGHAYGDVFLTEVAQRLPTLVRHGDLVARIGGDEFAVLLAEDASSEAAIAIAERIASACTLPVELNGLAVAASASVGITIAPTHGGDVETLLRRADIAMYVAKRAGKTWSMFDSEDVSIERLTVSADIGRAIEAHQFELWFQPKVELKTGRVLGAEGLIRWRHPDRGLLLPDAFLELVRLSGHNDALTYQALRMGIEHARECVDAGYDIDMAVNVSALSLHDEQLPSTVEQLLKEYGLPAERLLLEVTETEIMDDMTLIDPVMRQVADLGVGVSIDDFGTGHSSLVRIRKLPVTELKIDRSFISPLLHGGSDEVIVQSIVDLASRLGLRTVAEGVEDSRIAERLAEFGCDMAQGFLWSPALRPENFMELMRNGAQVQPQFRNLPAPEPLS